MSAARARVGSRSRRSLAALVSLATGLATLTLAGPASAAPAVPAGADCTTAGSASSGPTATDAGTPTVRTVSYVVATGTSTIDVPAGVTTVRVDACGAEGESTSAATGGMGGRTQATITLGSGASRISSLVVVAGGMDGTTGGGGAGGTGAGNGGGYSGVFSGSSATPTAVLVVAGGGGGAGSAGIALNAPAGGDGGGDSGTAGSGAAPLGGGPGVNTGPTAGGGTAGIGTHPGSPGSALEGGDGGSDANAGPLPPASSAGGGGGGGGYWGGGGGGATAALGQSGGGGGGSGYLKTGTATGTTVAAQRSGDGVVLISYDLPTPTITTQASPDTTVGSPISDTATVTTTGETPTATITFDVYGPDDASCTALVHTESRRVNGNGVYHSRGYVPLRPGTYQYVASYTGDANNGPATTACNDPAETVTVRGVTGIVTSATPTAVIGHPISDSATVTNAATPTGTIRFDVYGPNDASCSTTPAFTDSEPVDSGGHAQSAPYTPSSTGTYRWIASYSGDAHNTPAQGTCGDQGETSTVTTRPATITTSATPTATIGSPISDSATVRTTGPTPTGAVTFRLYPPTDPGCTGSPVFTSTRPMSNHDAQSGPYTPASAGKYHWIATYSGDPTYGPAQGTCGDSGETSTVNTRPATITTSATPTATIGSPISDSATVRTAGAAPTGTVTFRLYPPADAGCTGTPVFTSTQPITNHDAQSGPYTPTDAGSYHWTATYSGDATHSAASGACGDPGETSDVTPAGGGGGGGGTTGGSTGGTTGETSPSPSPSSSTSPSPSPTASASATASPTPPATKSPAPPGQHLVLTLDSTSTIKPGIDSLMTAVGAANADVVLRCYSRSPDNADQQSPPYFDARTASLGTDGTTQFVLHPGTNTRCFVEYLGSADDDARNSDSIVQKVATDLSLSAYRDGVRVYHFQGTNLPRRAGQLITLYRYATGPNLDKYCVPDPESYTSRVAGSCVAIRTATAFTNSSNVWRINRTFTGSGQFYFVARTSNTLTNVAGFSNQRLTVIH